MTFFTENDPESYAVSRFCRSRLMGGTVGTGLYDMHDLTSPTRITFSGDGRVMVMCLVRAAKDESITGSSSENDLTATGERPFRISCTFVNRTFFRSNDRFHAAVGETSAANGSRDGIKQRTKFVM